MEYRTFTEADFAALQELDLTVQRHLDPQFDQLPEREREGRLMTSLAALRFYERSEHSFVAAEAGQAPAGLILAQHVWQGDRPILLVRSVLIAPTASADTAEHLLHACVKSGYDCAIYEIHLPLTPQLQQAAQAENPHIVGLYAVRHLGSRQETAPYQKLTDTNCS